MGKITDLENYIMELDQRIEDMKAQVKKSSVRNLISTVLGSEIDTLKGISDDLKKMLGMEGE